MNEHPLFSEDSADDDAPYEWLDEWLCEYVDGTMDPALKIVFEEYVEANPELKAHVEKLRETRNLLCNCAPPQPASKTTQARVCGRVECEMLRSHASFTSILTDRPVVAVSLASSVVALVLGLFAGAVLFTPERTPDAAPTSTVERAGPRPSPIVTAPASRVDRRLTQQPVQALPSVVRTTPRAAAVTLADTVRTLPPVPIDTP